MLQCPEPVPAPALGHAETPQIAPIRASSYSDLVTRPLLNRRLGGLGNSIFGVMSARAVATDSINLGQVFPDVRWSSAWVCRTGRARLRSRARSSTTTTRRRAAMVRFAFCKPPEVLKEALRRLCVLAG